MAINLMYNNLNHTLFSFLNLVHNSINDGNYHNYYDLKNHIIASKLMIIFECHQIF
jgi:hypothetical protein